MFQDDILHRLQMDPVQITLGRLMQDRESASREIERLMLEVSRLRAAGASHMEERPALSSPGPGQDSGQPPFRAPALISITEVCRLLGISRSSVYMKLGMGTFPRPLRLGPRTVRWRIDAIKSWIEARPTNSKLG